MTTASVYIATSLDGFIAREDGALDWLPGADPEEQGNADGEDYGYHAFMESVDVIVMGRKTFEQVLTFGPWFYNVKVYVLSSRGVVVPNELNGKVEVTSGSPQEVMHLLEAAGYKHAYIDGGETIQQFIREGMLQQLIVTRIPILLGSGRPLFGPLEKDIKVTHQETKQYPSGFVQCRYEIEQKPH